MDKQPETLAGRVDTVVYQNEDNGYTVLRLDMDQGGAVTATGCIPFISPGEILELEGEWVTHPFHGEQFKVARFTRRTPRTAKEILEYLSAGVIKGIGPATARAIVDCFGDNALHVIEEQPERLAELKGITEKRALEIGESYRRQTGLRRLLAFFVDYDIKLEYAMRLYKAYGDDAQAALMDNPYILVDEYFGADFAQADKLALELGFEADAQERVEAAFLFELAHNANNGHCFIPKDKLVAVVCALISVEAETARIALDELIAGGRVKYEEIAGQQACYLRRLYAAETFVATRLKRIAYDSPAPLDAAPYIAAAEREMGLRLADGQRMAVQVAASSAVMALTGGPGTGKTTTVRAILHLYDQLGLQTALAAPTGRAAKRMSELCSREATTIHRLLETGYDPDLGELVFTKCDSDPIDADVVILDESSMVDILLLSALMGALRPHCRLILVGDADQLPSVGPGKAFLDIIRSGAIPTVRLTEVFRQAQESCIVRNAHQINKGEVPNLSENKGDFFFLARRDGEKAVETILELCTTRLPKNMGIDPTQIQVLSPTRLYSTGTVNLNRRLQAALNPPDEQKAEKPFGDFVFRTGDRVMQIRNNYDIIWKKGDGSFGTGVFNGDIGHISAIDIQQQTMTVDYDDKLVQYSFDMLSELELAYAMTVHKSQGSEYRAVILSLVKSAQSLLSRAILYTAVTRARELLIIVGDRGIVEQMVLNDKPQKRYSALRARLAQG